jgi:hypothetical protein
LAQRFAKQEQRKLAAEAAEFVIDLKQSGSVFVEGAAADVEEEDAREVQGGGGDRFTEEWGERVGDDRTAIRFSAQE